MLIWICHRDFCWSILLCSPGVSTWPSVAPCVSKQPYGPLIPYFPNDPYYASCVQGRGPLKPPSLSWAPYDALTTLMPQDAILKCRASHIDACDIPPDNKLLLDGQLYFGDGSLKGLAGFMTWMATFLCLLRGPFAVCLIYGWYLFHGFFR
jgi:hypothetical protein